MAFLRIKTIKVHMEPQMILNSKKNLKKKNGGMGL